MSPKRYWARLGADLKCPLRRGAWYRVTKLGPLKAVLDVVGEPVDIPRPFLEIMSTPPRRWSVVPRPKNSARFPGVSPYAVCPNCRARAPLDEQPPAMRCKRCNEVFEVAWGELYFGGGETRDSDVDLE